MHSKSDSRKIMVYDKANEAIEERYELLLSRYQIWLEILKKIYE